MRWIMPMLVAVASVATFTSEPSVSSGDLGILRRESYVGAHWLFAATLWTPLSQRDWIVTVAVILFAGFNFYLWSLPISQLQLFLIIAFILWAPRK